MIIYLVRIIYRFGLYISSSSIKKNVTPVVPTVCPVNLVLAVGVSLVLALYDTVCSLDLLG